MAISKRRQEMGEEAWEVYQKERRVRKVVNYRRNRKRKIIAKLGGKCSICGYCKDVPGAFHLHHKNPTEKKFGISDKGHCLSWDTVSKEIDKCTLVCANCHAELHQNE